MLSRLSGRMHRVYTGVTVMRGERIITDYERTCVSFRSMSEREIRAYIATGEPMDKAGAYGAQGIGALFVETFSMLWVCPCAGFRLCLKSSDTV